MPDQRSIPDQIDADSEAAAGLRITGTPTFIVGKSGGDWVEGSRIIGAQSYAVFDSAIRLGPAGPVNPGQTERGCLQQITHAVVKHAKRHHLIAKPLAERNPKVVNFLENIQAFHRPANRVGNDLTGKMRRVDPVT